MGDGLAIFLIPRASGTTLKNVRDLKAALKRLLVCDTVSCWPWFAALVKMVGISNIL